MSAAGESFVRAFHARHPGCTRTGFARGGSYARLASVVPVGARVLDLACGDGVLIEHLIANGHAIEQIVGVDVSRAELAAARVPCGLVEARAQALPLRDGSFDVCVCHLGLMVMGDLDPVVSEIARVLRPGGVFAAVLGGGPLTGVDDAFARFVDRLAPAVDAAGGAVRLGDPRLRSARGIEAVLGGVVTQEDHVAVLDGTIDQVWDSLATVYESAVVGEAGMATLRREWERDCADLIRPDGTIACAMRVRLVSVHVHVARSRSR
jgi:SAM-dependent methyltransferase